MANWRVRITHLGGAALRVEHTGADLVFDPLAPAPGAVNLITWQELGRISGVQRAARAGERPRVVGSPAVLDWLETEGPLEAVHPPSEVEGVRLEVEPYEPIPWATPAEGARKALAALRRPLTAVGRMAGRLSRPPGRPRLYELTFPDGARLLHLGCALHAGVTESWLAAAQRRYRGADWVVVGVDYEEEAAVLEMLPGFEPGVVMLTDLINRERAEIGMPTRLLTPTVDKLIDRRLAAHPFAAGATFRFA